MTQYARPVSDISNTGWGSTPLFSKLNEPAWDDNSHIASSTEVDDALFTVALGALAWPKAGQQRLTVRLRGVDAVAEETSLVIELLQGNNVIAMKPVETPSALFQNVTLDLTAQEIAKITNYTNLRVRVRVLGPVQVPCCPNPIKPILTATVSGAASLEIKLVPPPPDFDFWRGTFYCGDTYVGLNFECISQGWTLFLLSGSEYCTATPRTWDFECDPLNVEFTPDLSEQCPCGTPLTIMVTE